MKRILPLALVLLCAVSAQADWKSWLHGAPAQQKPLPPDDTAARVSFAQGVAPDEQILDFMRAFAEAVRAHNGTSLKPHVSDKYTIEGLPPEQSPMDFLMQAITIVPGPNELIVNSIEPDGDGRVAKVEFRSSSRPPKTRTFHLDSAGKLLASDFFSLQRSGHGS